MALPLFVGTSAEFAAGHVPGARWIWWSVLEDRIRDLLPDQETSIVVVCNDSGDSATLAAASLGELGYGAVAWLEGGMQAWRSRGLALEEGLAGVAEVPTDVLPTVGTRR